MDIATRTPTSRTQAPRPPKRQPLVPSVGAIRAMVLGLTLLSLGGMTAYAGTHVQNSSAPLTPAAAVAVASMAPTAVAQTGTGTLTLSSTVQTTTQAAVTTTHRS